MSVRHDYHAFGEEITNPASDTERMKFGGFERDFCCASGGIGGDDRDGGLFYASTIGRFRSVTLGEDPSSSQTWNGYAQPESGGIRLRPTPDNEECPGCPRSDMEIEVIGQVPMVGVYIPWEVWRLIIANPTRPAGPPGTQPPPPPAKPPTVVLPPRVGPRVVPWVTRVCALAGAIAIGHELGVRAGECVREAYFERPKREDCEDEAHAFLALNLEWCKQEYRGANPHKLLECERDARRRWAARIDECRREHP